MGGAVAVKDRGWTVGEEQRKETRSIHGASRLASRHGFSATKEDRGEGQRLGNRWGGLLLKRGTDACAEIVRQEKRG